MAKQDIKLPESTMLDAAHAVAKAAVPVAATAATLFAPTLAPVAVLLPELFTLLVQQPLERRRDEFLRSVQDRLCELEARGLDVGALADNEQFVTIVVLATQAAVKTRQTEKLRALRNCVLNVAVGNSTDEVRIQHFLSAIDGLNVVHIEMLKIVHEVCSASGLPEFSTSMLRASRTVPDRVRESIGIDATESLS